MMDRHQTVIRNFGLWIKQIKVFHFMISLEGGVSAQLNHYSSTVNLLKRLAEGMALNIEFVPKENI